MVAGTIEIRRILSAIEQDNPQAAGQLLTLVNDGLRRLVAHKLCHETHSQTLQATALVKEVYLRLVGKHPEQRWGGASLRSRYALRIDRQNRSAQTRSNDVRSCQPPSGRLSSTE
jgi:hypothetical protein